MMELECSPRHSPTGSSLLLSPRHAHGSHLDGFPSIKQIRRSLSRSPSKPQKYTLFTAKSTSMGSSLHAHPSALSRTHSAVTSNELVTRQKYQIKRSVQTRTSSRRTSPNSPLRRALSDNTNYANVAPSSSSHPMPEEKDKMEQENRSCEGTSPSQDRIRDDPIKIDFLKPDRLLQPVLRDHASPMKSSPLKRSDGVMNLEAASFASPRIKRRSLHGASFGNDFNVFDHGFDATAHDMPTSPEQRVKDHRGLNSSTWPNAAANSPQRRPFSLRRSTLQQRTGPSRARQPQEPARETMPSPALTRARSRISLDSALPLRTFDVESSFRRTVVNEPPVFMQPAAQKPYQSAPKPHPLSHALTPSSSSSSMTDDPPLGSTRVGTVHRVDQTHPSFPPVDFSKSLPIGAMRQASREGGADQAMDDDSDSFATPNAYKLAKPLPQAFMSTGLISKRNRNIDMDRSSLFSSTHMPDTPSKKAAHVHITSPAGPPSALGKLAAPVHEFGSPSTPFNARISKAAPESFGKGTGIFGSRVGAPQLTRRGSFISVDGDDVNNSPSRCMESQAGSEELPPTPTKSTSNAAARPQSRGKSNSLRSSLFGRRTSLGLETFNSPVPDDEVARCDHNASPMGGPNDHVEGQVSPQTPQEPCESFTPPDPSCLSISVEHRPSTAFRGSNFSFPPATPTGPRDSFGSNSLGQGYASANYFSNDVDTSLTARFGQVTTSGIGEFSQVYRVEKPHPHGPAASQLRRSPSGNVWAVKKSRRPYTGHKDRQRKMREVQILQELREHEHVIELVDSWESKNHLYIQTEYCENGNLKDFLTSTGFKGRLDDFRIWKILLELSQGVESIHTAGFIHLDLKPANVFIDWEGVLKIGDFGMASQWPAPVGLDGEGDREYIGPEVLSGRFDKPADIFALGMIMLEIAGNIVLPDNGSSWQRLRAGDMSDLPSLTWSSDSSLIRDESGDPIEMLNSAGDNDEAENLADDLSFLKPRSSAQATSRAQDLVQPPNFMIDPSDLEALDRVVQWMILPDPDQRPTVDQLLQTWGVQWVGKRRRAGATVYEGNWGPSDDVLQHEEDVEMLDI